MTMNISVGNSVWWMVIALCCAVTALVYLSLRKKSDEQKRKALLLIGCTILVLFYVQRILMFRFDAFIAAYGTGWKQILPELLPFNLCYLSVIVMIAGARLNNKHLLGFCFFISSLGAVLALVAPVGIFSDTNLLQPAVAMFYFLHILVAAAYWNIGFLGLVKPEKNQAITSMLLFYFIFFLIHLVNWLGRSAGIDSMNYFYSFNPEGSSVLELFWEWLPIPCLYMIVPGTVIFGGWAALLTLLYRRVVLLRARKGKTYE
ncbi:MAG: YwaF family protein [Firmicutes bacterium]|nr:YwaF family protein [Bacillota bacterium]